MQGNPALTWTLSTEQHCRRSPRQEGLCRQLTQGTVLPARRPEATTARVQTSMTAPAEGHSENVCGERRPEKRAWRRRPAVSNELTHSSLAGSASHTANAHPIPVKICSSTSETNLLETTEYLSYCFLAQKSDVCMEKYRQLHTSWCCNI